MKRFIRLGVLLAALAAVVFLFIVSFRESKPLRLGYVSSLSGKFSALAVSGRDGAVLAVEQLNARGGVNGKPLKLVIHDDAFQAETARNAVRQLNDQGVAAIIGPFASAMAKAMLPVAQELGVLLVSPSVSSDEFSGQDDLFIQMVSTTAECSRGLGRYCAGQLKLKSLVAVADNANQAYTDSAVRHTRQGFLDAGGEDFRVIDYDSRQSPSFADLAQKALAGSPDGVLMVSSALDTAAMCQRLRLLDQKVQLLSATWGISGELIQSGGRAVEGIITMEAFDPGSQNPAYLKFVADYSTRFGRSPDSSSMVNYETVMLLAQALRRDPSATGGALRRAILDHNPHVGLQSDFVLNQTGDVKRPLFLLTVTGGKLVVKD